MTTTVHHHPRARSADDGALPEGWAQTHLGDLVELKYGKGLPEKSRVPGEVPVYGSNGPVGVHDVAHTAGPTVIVGRKGSVGAVHLSDVACWPIDTTYYVDEFRAFEPLLLAKLLAWMRLDQQEASTAIPGLNRDEAYSRLTAVPPLAEQERIVEAVERLTARVDSARERLANVPKILKRFRQAVLAAACSGRLTEDWREARASMPAASELLQVFESRSSKTARARLGSAVEPDPTLELPTGWIWSPLNLLCDEIVDCPHPTPKWTDSGRLCVRTTNFNPGYLNLSTKHFVSDDTFRERISRLVPKSGDLLYSREGGILGIACLIPPDTQLCLGQRMMLIRAWPEVSAPYVMHCLNSSIVLKCVRDLTGGTASPHLNVGDIKQFQIPLPPTPEQQEIVCRVASLMKLADAIERRVVAAAARADKITQAVLAKAFRGELVPTEAELARRERRNYEPATVLLERMKTERQTAAKKPHRRHQ